MAKKAKSKARRAVPVFEQIGFSPEESAELVRRSHLLDEVLEIVKQAGYTQKDLVRLTGLGQPHVSELLNGRLSRFSTEKLIGILESLGASVQIKVKRPA